MNVFEESEFMIWEEYTATQSNASTGILHIWYIISVHDGHQLYMIMIQ